MYLTLCNHDSVIKKEIMRETFLIFCFILFLPLTTQKIRQKNNAIH